MTSYDFRRMALSFQGAMENPHFDRIAFKVVNSRIFATLHEESNTANIRLSPEEQTVFVSYDNGSVYPVPNKWGLQGWTTFILLNVPDGLLFEALNSAYEYSLKQNRIKKKEF